MGVCDGGSDGDLESSTYVPKGGEDGGDPWVDWKDDSGNSQGDSGGATITRSRRLTDSRKPDNFHDCEQ